MTDEDKLKYEEFLKTIENEIKYESLKNLFKCFYSDLDKDDNRDKILNTGLNLFFGNFDCINKIENNVGWKNKFKKSIKEKYKTEKKDKSGNNKYKLKDPSKKTLESLTISDYLDKAKKQWLHIRIELDEYFDKIKKPINKTLIYEAPPYSLSIVENSEPVETNFEAEFIFHPNCSSPYVYAIKNCFNDPEEVNISNILAKNGVGFFDVIPIPIPINSDLRTLWAVNEKFSIDKKRIFVHFFEWALKIYLFKLGERIDKKKHKIAIGIPLKNAVTLYEYHSEKLDWFDHNDFSCINFSEEHSFDPKNTKPDGLWVQKYKNCIIGSSNTPSDKLMEIAFKDTE